MANPRAFPELNLSPDKLRLSYTLGSKSTKSTTSKKCSIQTLETPPESLTKRISLSPKKPLTGSIPTLMSKLQIELDSEELTLKANEVKDFPSPKRKKAEQEIYAKYMQSLIKRILKVNENLGRLLERGWRGYQNSLTISETAENTLIQIQHSVESKSQTTQVTEEMLVVKAEEEIEIYINSLHRVIKGMNSMHISKIISKLDELSNNMRPVDIPSLSGTPDVEELDFTETVKSIHSRLKASVFPRREKVKTEQKVSVRLATCQTLLKADDLRIIDEYKANLGVKENLIADLTVQMRRKEESEELLKARNREIDELKRDIMKLKQECPLCIMKKKQLERSEQQLKNLQITISNGFGIEKELDETKRKLAESLEIINLKQSKIAELSKTVEDLETKFENARILREKLQKQLNHEEYLRKSIETELQKQIDSNTTLKLALDPFSFHKTLENPLENSAEIPETKIPTSPPKKTQISFRKSSSASPDKKRTIIRAEIQVPEPAPKKKKKDTIMSILGMSKEEYLSLSKKARLNLYICLMQHTQRCGTDCEHLRRAMMIRYKDRGPLFPVKKYNIE